MTDWKPLTELHDNWVGAFVAVYNDGSGAKLYTARGNGVYETNDGDPCDKPDPTDYQLFAWLPEGFKTWGDLTND